MIYTERVINVKNGDASIDQTIVLYRGDRNIEIVFEIVNNKFKFSEKGNYILDIGAKYGQLAVDMPDGTDLFTEIAECMDGKVIFKITGDMINEIAENGFYSFHVRLFNEDKTSRVTIPPIMQGIEIREPIVIEGDGIFPIVDTGTSDVAVIDSDKESFIDEDGKLNIEWKNGDIISSARLNQMVEFINDMEDKLVSEDNLAKYATNEHVDVIEEQLNNHVAGLTNMITAIDNTASSAINIAQEARDSVNNKYDEFNIRLENQQNTLERFEVTVSLAEAKASSALAEVNTLDDQVDKNKSDISDIYDKLDLNYVHADTMNYQHGLLQSAINQNGDHISTIADQLNTVDETITDHASRIQALEEADYDVDLTDYATIEYVNDMDNLTITDLEQTKEDLADIRQRVAVDMPIVIDEITQHVDHEVSRIEFDVIEPLESTVSDHTARITTLEETISNIPDIPDLSGYATTKYVDGQISEIQTAIEILPDNPANPGFEECVTRRYVEVNFVEGSYLGSNYYKKEYIDGEIGTLNNRIDILDNEIADAGLDMLREDLESVRAIAEEGMSEEKRAEFRSEIMEGVEADFIHPIDEALGTHDERIQALEEADNDVDLSGYATTEYVDSVRDGLNEGVEWELNIINKTCATLDSRIDVLEQAGGGNADLTGYATKEYVDQQDAALNDEWTEWLEWFDAHTYAQAIQYSILERDINTNSDNIATLQSKVEILPDDPENPGESECVIRQYVYDHFVNTGSFNMRVTSIENNLTTLNDWTVEEVDKLTNRTAGIVNDVAKINNTLGDINAILDAINGEVI